MKSNIITLLLSGYLGYGMLFPQILKDVAT